MIFSASHKKLLMSLLMVFAISISHAQKSKIARADKQYDEYSYIDARKIYLEVVESGYKSGQIYNKIADTYYLNADYDDAYKWYDKLVKEFPESMELEDYYRAAQVYKIAGDQETYESLINQYYEKGGERREIIRPENSEELLGELGLVTSKFLIDSLQANSRFSDFGPSYFGTDKVVFASSNDTRDIKVYNWNNLPYLNLYEGTIDTLTGQLNSVRKFSENINTEFHESSAAFTKDGKTMYFTRNNYIDGKKRIDKKKRIIRLKIYSAKKDASGNWNKVTELPFNGNNYSTSHPTLSPDEKRLYFASDRPGGFGKSDIYYIDILPNNEFSLPVNLGDKINSSDRETFPFISSENNLYFSSDGFDGLGGLDVYVTKLKENGMATGDIANFGAPINSNKDDFGFIFNEEKRNGYFSSNIDGGRGSLDDDIYYFYEKCFSNVKGVITNKLTGEPIPSATVMLLDENNQLIETLTVNEKGEYLFKELECQGVYLVRGTHPDYLPDEESFETPSVGGLVAVDLQLEPKDPCPPNDLGCRLNLQPIYFDFDRYNIRPDAAVELAKILAAMRQYPELIIHIESHTDSRGKDSYNEALSEKRAQSTLGWLVEKGISKNRLTAKGYGEYRLQNECSNGVECTEEAHQLNRRSMFIIQN